MRQYHDMRGLPAGPVERQEHDHAPWEKRVDALMMLSSQPQRSCSGSTSSAATSRRCRPKPMRR